MEITKLEQEREEEEERQRNLNANPASNLTISPDVKTMKENRQMSNLSLKTPKTPKSKASNTPESKRNVFRDSADSNSRTVLFANTLKTSHDSNKILTELTVLANDQLKDSKKIFEFICRGFDEGKAYQFNPKRTYEEVDLSQYSTTISLANVTKLEDLNQMKKKRWNFNLI